MKVSKCCGADILIGNTSTTSQYTYCIKCNLPCSIEEEKPMNKPTTVNAKTLIDMGADRFMIARFITIYGYHDVEIKTLYDDSMVYGFSEAREWIKENFPWCFEEKKPKKVWCNKPFPSYTKMIKPCYWNLDGEEYVNGLGDRLSRSVVDNNPELFEVINEK